MTENFHPWQSDIIKLVKLAAFHLSKDTAFDNRIAFLLFDVSIESIFKTYLTLPDEITHAAINYHKRMEAVQSNFHTLIKAIKEVAPTVDDNELLHIKFFHDQRNKLYHHGTGITISHQNAISYGQLTISMLDKLLAVDLSGLLVINSELMTEVQQMINHWQTGIDDFQDVVYRAIESIEPKLLYPSSQRRLKTLSTNDISSDFTSQEDGYRLFVNEVIENKQIKTWLNELIDPSPSIALSYRNFSTMMGWLEDPVYFCLLIIGAFLVIDDDFSTMWLNDDEEIEIVENIENHVFNSYSSVKANIKVLGMFTDENMLRMANLERFKTIFDSGNEQLERLRAKQDFLLELLSKK